MTARAIAALAAICFASTAQAQQVYGPVNAEPVNEDAPRVLVEDEACEDAVQDDGTILVCRERVQSERYMSPLPPPIDGDRGLLIPPDVSTLPPCVHAPPLSFCPKLGRPPPPLPMVDTTAFPEPLSAEDAARVSRVGNDPAD